MAVNLSIKGVPADIAERLRQRAERNHRSLQGELMAIIEQAADAKDASVALPTSAGSPGGHRNWTHGHKTIEQLMAEREAAGWKPDPRMALLPTGTDLIRADRDSR